MGIEVLPRLKLLARKGVRFEMSESKNRLIEFYGEECHWCVHMAPVIERLEKDEGVEVTRLEVWHDRENKRELGQHAYEISSACGGGIGVPAFYNEKTGEALCGAQSYDELKRWALAS